MPVLLFRGEGGSLFSILGERMLVLRRISAAFAAKSGTLEAHLRPAGRWSEETEEGHPPSRTAGGPGGGLTGLCRRFPLPPVGGESASSDPVGKGGESASSDPVGKGGKVPVQTPVGKGGESAIFGAGGDQPPLATSRRCCLAAARLCVPPSDPAAEAGGPPAVPGPAGAVLTGDRDG